MADDDISLDNNDATVKSCNFSVLSWEQVQRLDSILTETIPIHGRGNFPTLEMKPRQIVKVVRSRMEERKINVRDVRLNGSAASHVLHEDSGLGYKDLDLIFCADLKSETEFQIVKDIVLDCLLDFLPVGVNKEKITPLTLKVTFRIVSLALVKSHSSSRWLLCLVPIQPHGNRPKSKMLMKTSIVKSIVSLKMSLLLPHRKLLIIV